MNASWRQINRPLAYALIAIAPAITALFIARYGVNIPFWDQWELVPLIQAMHDHSLGFEQLWVQHNEHRILFPKFIMLKLAEITQWNIRAELWLNLVLACGYFGFLYLLIRSTFQELGKPFRLWSSVLASWLVFSPVQWENWLWGWQIPWYLLMLCLSGAIFLLWWWPKRGRFLVFLAAAVFATIGTYSLANGIMIWAICLPLLWLRRANKLYWLLWITMAGTIAITYFYGYVKPAHHPSFSVVLERPLDLLLYVAVYLGRGISFSNKDAMYFGLLLIGLYLVSILYILRQKPSFFLNLSPWLMISSFSVISALSTGVGRLGFGLQQAAASRYTTVSLVFSVTAILVTTIALRFWLHQQKRRKLTWVPTVAIALLVLTIGSNLFSNHSMMKREHIKKIAAKECLRDPNGSPPGCLLLIYPNQQIILERASYLRELEWGGLQKPIISSLPPTS